MPNMLLVEGHQHWPQQTGLIYSLALYANKIKDKTSIKIVIAGLQVLMPNYPQVQQWLVQNGQ